MSQHLDFRSATQDDLERIVDMLADDHLGQQLEHNTRPLPTEYRDAFEAIERDPNNDLVVACADGVVVGVLQITFIPNLSHLGAWRALIEGVRIHRDYRAQGLGHQMFEWAIAQAKTKGCRMVQLTTDKSRPQAKAFYEQLGFVPSHEGMKLHLTD
ncbi:GNAT family N-acetyltransferase [Candidatus Entotheonella serta]|nr:GNAT family N-acetyltransferase [Candidatus Entotheonella serta]